MIDDRPARPARVVAALAAFALVTAACGARLDDDRRELAIEAALSDGGGIAGGGSGGGTTTGEGTGGTATTGATGTTDGGSAATTTGEAGSGGAATGGETAAGGDDTTGGATATGGDTGAATTATGGDPGGSATTGGQGAGDTRAAPPGGNGGATDVGVTEDRIVIANIVDKSGPVPGLFADAQLAVQAYFQMFANTEGTIYGRRIQFAPADSRMASGGNRSAYQQACDQAFMATGSMSAFDQGAASPIESCGIPDLRTIAVNPSLMQVPNSYSADAINPNQQPLTEYLYWKEKIGAEGVKRSCYLWIAGETTEFQTGIVREGTRQIGYEWVIEQPIEISESNYAPFVNEMKKADCAFVTFQGAYQQAVKLAEAMRQQSFWPQVYGLQSNVYLPEYLQLGGADVQDTEIAVPSVILEEIDQHPELQRYAQWLQRIDPEARPTGLGMYAWSSAMLTVELIEQVGPELTRAKLLDALAKVDGFDGNGLIPPQRVGAKVPADCVIIVKVADGAFQRLEPASGMRCDNRVVDVGGGG